MEIERKFLVRELPDLSGVRFSEIKQGYFSIKPERRVRKMDNIYLLTEKGEGDMVREEIEREIDEKTALEYFAQSKTYIIEKKRYFLNYGNFTIELDIYEGRHKGKLLPRWSLKMRGKPLILCPLPGLVRILLRINHIKIWCLP